MNIYAIGTVFVQVALGMNAFITAQGFSRTSMLTVLIGAGAQYRPRPAAYVHIRHGRQGRGAGHHTLAGGVGGVGHLVPPRQAHGAAAETALHGPAPKLLLPCLALGVSPFIMQATEAAINVCFNRQLALYGGALAVSAMTILASVMQFAMLPLQGLTQGAQPITSYNYGRKERRARARLLPRALCRLHGPTPGRCGWR